MLLLARVVQSGKVCHVNLSPKNWRVRPYGEALQDFTPEDPKENCKSKELFPRFKE